VPLCQQGLSGPPGLPYGGESATQVYPNDASRLPPPILAQLTGGAQEQSPGTAQLTGAQEAEPHRHRSAASGEQYSCKRCPKIQIFTRRQELARHNREVHGSDPPHECRLCPPHQRPWKRPYLMKRHLINDHDLPEDVLERILILEGKDFFEFVDAL
jgi:hypothetical protein